MALIIGDDGRLQLQRGPDAQIKRGGNGGFYPTAVIVSEGDKLGLYSNETFRMVLPAEYDAMDRKDEGYFVAWKYRPGMRSGIDSTVLTDLSGKIIFALKGGYDPHREDGYWFLRGQGGSPVVDNKGRTIVPDGYHIKEIVRSTFFIVGKEERFGIISKGGKWLTEPKLLEIDQDYDQRGFMTGHLLVKTTGDDDEGKRFALISPDGIQLTRAIYEEIRITDDGILFRRGKVKGYLSEKGKEIALPWPESESD